MKFINTLIFKLPAHKVHAHCDLPCGVYDPAQARIEAQSVYNIMKKFKTLGDDNKEDRGIFIKEQRAELVKKHLWVLWTDYFKEEHLEEFPNLHALFWKATKAAGDAKKSTDPAVGQKLIEHVDEIGEIFAKTKAGYDYKSVIKNLDIQSA